MLTIGFSQGGGVASKFIMWASKAWRGDTTSLVSHAFLCYRPEPRVVKDGYVIQAGNHGIERVLEADFRKSHTVVGEFAITLPPLLELDMYQFARAQVGKPYDWLGILGLGWVLANRAVGRAVGNPLHQNDSYVCSAFALAVLKYPRVPAWYQTLAKYDVRTTTPKDLMNDLLNLSGLYPDTLKWMAPSKGGA
jgi:hypothetical protein